MAGATAVRDRLDPVREQQLRQQIARKLRPSYDDVPEIPVGQYPRMLFNASFHQAQQDWIATTDELQKKKHVELMSRCIHTVQDPEEEEEWLRDGWKPSPADFLEIDPRVPVGREARRVDIHNAAARRQRILELRRELAQLSGDDIAAILDGEDEAPTAAAPPRRAVASRRKRGRPRKVVAAPADPPSVS